MSVTTIFLDDICTSLNAACFGSFISNNQVWAKYIQSVSGGIVNILGGGSMDYSE